MEIEKARMRIACVAYLHGAGGAERQIIMLANGLSSLGHEVHLVVLYANRACYPIDDRVIVHDLAGARQGQEGILGRFLALRECLRSIAPDVSVHYWMQSAYFAAAMPKRITGSVVYSERGDPGDSEYRGLLGFVRGATFPRLDGFVFQTEAARDYFNGSVAARSAVIPNPVAVPAALVSDVAPKRQKRIVAIGRLAKQKNHQLLIRAFARLSSEFPEYILEIYGEGDLRDCLCSLARSLGVADRVRIIDPCTDIFVRIKEASLFVLPSLYEGMPNALLEAMSLGLPCVTTDYAPKGAAGSIVSDKWDGVIVPDDEENLSQAIFEVLSDTDYAAFLSKNARESGKRFSSEQVFGQWESYLRKVVNT